MNWLGYFLAFSAAAVFCGWFVWRRHAAWLDQPGERSLHTVPVPRLGGVGICAGLLVGAVCLWPQWQTLFDPYLLAGAVALWAVAVLDDFRPLGQVPRLCCQLFAALLAVWGGQMFFSLPVLSWLWPVMGVLMILWGINLYNFMDGMDGFAGAMAVLGFGVLAVLAFMHADVALGSVCALIVAANLGFLVFNFPPARIFMGDSGSTVLGFAMVTLSILGWKREIYSAWVSFVVFSPFWVDASVTLCKRAWRREKIWQAHREHYYQRWVLAGFSHLRVLLWECALMCGCAASVMAWQAWGAGYNGFAVPGLWVLCYAAALLYSEWRLGQ